MSVHQLSQLNRILERDSTDTSYKYALMRAVSEICQDHNYYPQYEGVWYQTGFIVEKWIEYYYPLIESETFIPQKNAEKPLKENGKNIAFRRVFKEITDYYKGRGGFKAFWVQYKSGKIDDDINDECLELSKNIWYTITRYPMKHLGFSVKNNHYQFFNYRKRKRIKSNTIFSQELVINDFGRFWIEKDLWQALRYLGSYISGDYSIVNKWVQFSVRQDKKIKPEVVYQLLNTSPIDERDTLHSQHFFNSLIENTGSIKCVWSDKSITKKTMHIDHVVPFSVWRNNDLWNLLPTLGSVNLKKRDMIPSPKLLEQRKDKITDYWEQLDVNFKYQFNREVNITLLDGRIEEKTIDSSFSNLCEKCEYLINDRGLTEWTM